MRLDQSFYQQSDPVFLAKALLGKYLVSNIDGIRTAGRIVETEAYKAPEDLACHAAGNRRTKRTETMFMAGGVAYVYLCYGIHHLFNVVTGKENEAHAILIRGLEPIDGIEEMLKRRGMPKLKTQLSKGPGVLSKALGITTALDKVSLLDKNSPIWLEDRGEKVAETMIVASPRIGVDYAGECAQWPWRFYLNNNKWVSKTRK